MIQKRPPETPTCRAVGAHAADRKEDVGVTVEHLQRSPAVPLGEAGVPVQRPMGKEYSCVTGCRALRSQGTTSLRRASHKFLLGN